ncbi:MAG: hypothetical protein QOE08_2338 [Thermoleophilaceae bacterium]|jgi:cell wall-associated NlpC family hydrolase|nr:hypothetical protein [Thermoleophilaceae bacterium]
MLAACLLALACLAPATASATDGGVTASQAGGVAPDGRFLPTAKAKLVNGFAVAPSSAPQSVKNIIAAANSIATKPYRYGGGHKSFIDTAYDCSGSVSFALKGANLLTSPLDSSSFMRWGKRGRGRWVTVYTNPGHAFMVVAGLRFDTGYRGWSRAAAIGQAPGSGPRWGAPRPTTGFTARSPLGL